MFDAIKADIEQLKRGRSGSRFSDFYDFRQRHRRPGFSPARAITIFFGIALIVGGASIGWLPGPGGFVAIFGLALLAQEFRPMARLLDWCEPKLHAAWNWVVGLWQRLSSAGRLAVAMTIVLSSVSMGYAAFSMWMR